MGRFVQTFHTLSFRTIDRYPCLVRFSSRWSKVTARWEPSLSSSPPTIPLKWWNHKPLWMTQYRMNSEVKSRADPDFDVDSFFFSVSYLSSPKSQQNHLSSASTEKPIHSKSGAPEKPSMDHEAFVAARQLLNLSIGSFQKENKVIPEPPPRDALYPIRKDPPVPEVNHYQMAADLLQFFLYDRKMCANDVRAINAAFAVLERLIREIIYTKSASENLQYAFQNATQFRMLVNFWKNAALAKEQVLPAIEMIKKIQWMTTELPSDSNKIILFDKNVLNMVFQVLMKQVSKDHAPFVAESLMEFVYFTIEQTNNADLEPDIFIYGQLMNAWINSGRPETPLKLDEILNDMHRHDVPLNTVAYGILIRYWAGKGSLTRITFLFEQMIAEGLEPDISCLGQALYGYTRAMQPLPAIEILEKMYGKLKFLKFKESAQDRATITASTLNILDSFKRLIIRGNDPATNISRAEEVVRKYESSNLTPSRSDDRVLGALMDIYAHAGRADDVEAMMQKMDQHDPVKYSILVRAYGKMDRADLATDVVFARMLNDPNITPAVHVFKMLIETWAVSSRGDAVEQAYSIFHRMDESVICQKHNLRPDSFMFGGLLKVIGASKRSDCGTRAIAILEDMERRSRETNDKSLLPNKVIYDLALNVCLQGANDIHSTEEILKRMETSDFSPDLRLYNEVLSSYSLVNSVEAPERAEKMLDYIKNLSKSDSQLKPNDFTYNAVINCWIASQDSTAPDRAWLVYEQMLEDCVRPNTGTFNALIPFLSKSNRGLPDVGRADSLLALMESGRISGVSPDRRHYGPVMNGWIAIGEVQKAADVLLRRVKTYISASSQNKERCKPTPDHFYLVANGWIRVDKLVEATEFIEQMQALYAKGHIPDGPDLYSYLTLHSAWSRSNHSDAERYLEKLDAIISRMRPETQ